MTGFYPETKSGMNLFGYFNRLNMENKKRDGVQNSHTFVIMFIKMVYWLQEYGDVFFILLSPFMTKCFLVRK